MEPKRIPCYSANIATQLRKKGYKIEKVMPNYRHPEKDVYLFKDEGNIKEDLAYFIADRRQWLWQKNNRVF